MNTTPGAPSAHVELFMFLPHLMASVSNDASALTDVLRDRFVGAAKREAKSHAALSPEHFLGDGVHAEAHQNILRAIARAEVTFAATQDGELVRITWKVPTDGIDLEALSPHTGRPLELHGFVSDVFLHAARCVATEDILDALDAAGTTPEGEHVHAQHALLGKEFTAALAAALRSQADEGPRYRLTLDGRVV